MLVVFRADASPAIGGGHVMRCITLADELRNLGAECCFGCAPRTLESVPALARSGHRYVELPDSLEAAALSTAFPGGCDWLVVDHYGWNAEMEAACRPWAKRIFVIDDLANRRHDCDLLLDQTLGRRASVYRDLVSHNCAIVVGSKYALLRPEFAERRLRSPIRKEPARARRVLVSMGLSDPANLTPIIMKGILQSGLALSVDVVLGPSAPGLPAVKKLIEQHRTMFTLHIGADAATLADLLVECDFGVGAGGSSAWERCCLGVPAIIVIVAENQREAAGELARVGAALLVGDVEQVSPTVIANAVKSFVRDSRLRAEISGQAVRVCDGRGVGRIAMRVFPARAANEKPVWLRPAASSDVETILAWQSQPETRRFGRTRTVPTAEEHAAWFSARLRNPSSLLSVIVLDGTDAGTLRLDRLDENSYEVSIVVSNQFHGQGVGLAALELARRLVPEAWLRAEILPGNIRSEALFTRAGYSPQGYGWRSIEPLVRHFEKVDVNLSPVDSNRANQLD